MALTECQHPVRYVGLDILYVPVPGAIGQRGGRQRYRGWLAVLLALGAILIGVLTPWRAIASADNPMTFSGQLRAGGPCIINEGQPITVAFDTMNNTQVDGSNGRMPVLINLDCSASSGELLMRIAGTPATWTPGGEALVIAQMDMANLGLKFDVQGMDVLLNDDISFQASTPPELYVVPVRNQGADLPPGKLYSASARLEIDYP